LTRYLRSRYQLGIIILTTRHETVDRVVGLECGADDYVIKPFEERELLARIRSVLRRTSAAPSGATTGFSNTQNIKFQNHHLNGDACLLTRPDGSQIEVTANECKLLIHLVRNANQPQSREVLTEAVLHRKWDPLDRSIDVLVTRIR